MTTPPPPLDALQSVPLRGTTARFTTLALLLARPAGNARAALVLPIVAFAVTTALLLTIGGGSQMFLTDPRASGPDGYLYGPLGVLALVLLSVPIATLGAAAARLSSRRRDDRLATLRLLGATSAEVSALTVAEASVIALAGAVAGIGLYALLLPLVGFLPFFGGPVGIESLWIGWGWLALSIAGVVGLATLSAVIGLRRVQLTPLGVRRRSDPPPRKLTLLAIGLVGVVAIVFVAANFGALGPIFGPGFAIVALFGVFAGAIALVNLVGAPVIAARGRTMARRASTAAQLIAGRELAAYSAVAWRRVSGIAMISFIAVVGGAGMSLAAVAATGRESVLFIDIRTGVLVTLGAGFILLACSAGVTQAASVLEDRDLIVGLDRLGMPAEQLRRARRTTVMLPLRWAAVGGATVGLLLSVPIVGIALMLTPLSLVVVATVFLGGVGLVWVALAAAEPLVTSIRREASG